MDNTLTYKQAYALLEMQNRINSIVNPDWIHIDYAYSRAIFMEIAEAIDHYGWKWWTKQQCSISQVHIELIDALHFCLSYEISQSKGNLDACAKGLLESLTLKNITEPTSLLELLELICVRALSKKSIFRYIYEALSLSGIRTWNEIIDLYVKKNSLSLYRLENGYINGTYNKIWHGKEDNIYLEELPQLTEEDTKNTHAKLYKKIQSIHIKMRDKKQ